MLNFLSLILPLLIITLTFNSYKTKNNNNNNLSSQLTITAPTSESIQLSSETETYCTGIRGNGELIPAHWASLAKIIEEKKSAPVAGSGGSSASITLFILENFYNSPLIYNNKLVPDFGTDRKGLIARTKSIDPVKLSFLFKFLPHYLIEVGKIKSSEYSQVIKLKKTIDDLKKSDAKDILNNNLNEIFTSNQEIEGNQTNGGKLKKTIALLKLLRDMQSYQQLDKGKVSLTKLLSLAKQAKKESSHILDSYYLSYQDEIDEVISAATSATAFAKFKKMHPGKIKKVHNLAVNFKESLVQLGKFEVETDSNLFFRPGLIDFRKTGTIMNNVLGFFNHVNLNGKPKNSSSWTHKVHSFFDKCASAAISHDWIPKTHKDYKFCIKNFQSIVSDYYNRGFIKNHGNKLINQKVGQKFAAIATTSIINGNGYKRTQSLLDQYYADSTSDNTKNKVDKYSIDFEDNMFLGYWYNQNYKNLKPDILNNHNDVKSQKFLNLGNANWSDVLATSPAEPGLTNFRPLQTETEGLVLSSGGWSDLHPTIVLKELKDSDEKKICDKVYYITRKAGASNFGQMVIIKLLGLKNELKIDGYNSKCNFDTDKLNTQFTDLKNKTNEKRLFYWMPLINNNSEQCIMLSNETLATNWGRWSYWDNPKHISSFKKSANIADDVFCTNWNAFDVLGGEGLKLFNDTYHNSFWRGKEKTSKEIASSETKEKVTGCW